jgi:hypothetical protein
MYINDRGFAKNGQIALKWKGKENDKRETKEEPR